MHRPIISLIAALSENGVIGRAGTLPWHIPEDMKRFRALTTAHPVIMGRKTYESIGRLLPNRINIIISRDLSYGVKGGLTAASVSEAIETAKNHETREIFIIGGGQIYASSIGMADKLYLTIVHQKISGDTYFPDYSAFRKKIFEQKGESNGYSYTFMDLER